MVNVGSFEAKTHLSALLKRVIKGEAIQITHRGTAIAKIVPADASKSMDASAAVCRIRELRKGSRNIKIGARSLIDDARRF